MLKFLYLWIAIFLPLTGTAEPVLVGIDVLLTSRSMSNLCDKRIGLITNHTAVNGEMRSTLDLLQEHSRQYRYTIAALFAPEHGLSGSAHAWENVYNTRTADNIPVYGLFGKQQRPTPEMLANIDLLIYDIQDIGSRSYTYITTLFYVMEEAAKARIPVMVLDRPKSDQRRSHRRPYDGREMALCSGIYQCPLLSWHDRRGIGRILQYRLPDRLRPRGDSDEELESHHELCRNRPHLDTDQSECSRSDHNTLLPHDRPSGRIVDGQYRHRLYLPFKVLGAPWIDAIAFAKALNAQGFPGVYFQPFYFKPFTGKFAQEECQGVLIVISDHLTYQPVASQYLLIGVLKSLYPKKFEEALKASAHRKDMFCKVNGTEEVYRMISEEKNIVWKLRGFHQKGATSIYAKETQLLTLQVGKITNLALEAFFC